LLRLRDRADLGALAAGWQERERGEERDRGEAPRRCLSDAHSRPRTLPATAVAAAFAFGGCCGSVAAPGWSVRIRFSSAFSTCSWFSWPPTQNAASPRCGTSSGAPVPSEERPERVAS